MAKALMSSFTLSKIFEFLKPRRKKSIQYIALKFLGTVNGAVPFRYSELMFL